MSRTGPEVTVAGAGALGLACALALADAGCRVTVRDPAEPATGASGVAAGMLAPAFEAVLDETARPHLDLLLHARDLWPGLAGRAGIALDRAGALAVGPDAWLDTLSGRFATLGLPPTEITGSTARGLAPGLSEAVARALLTREDWRLDPRAALSALRAAGQAAGVIFRAEPLAEHKSGVLVIATGAASGLAHLAPELGRLSPIKGHILRIEAPAAAGVTIRGQGAYVAPAAGEVSVGATMEAGRDDPVVDPLQTAPLRAAAVALFPGLADAPARAFAGVRAATPDGLPFAGASAAPGVFLAVGARRNGWLLAPLVAEVVAATITGRDPGRFAGRLDPARTL